MQTKPATSHPATSQPATQPAGPRTEKITIAGEEFTLEIAADEAARQKGLMGRDHIKDHGGMLFVFPEPERQYFWMKNCTIDIDILYLDAKGKVVSVYSMKKEEPQGRDESTEDYEERLSRYDSRVRAQFAIELKAGTIERAKLKAGQTISLDCDRLAELARRSAQRDN